MAEKFSQIIKAAYTEGEELMNYLTHGFGLIISSFGAGVMIALAAVYGNVWQIVSASIFGFCLILLYAASTAYHAAKSDGAKRALKIFDHISIYFLIAGSYTPYMLVNLRGALGWTIFGIIWGLALLGTIFKLFYIGRFKIFSVMLYLLMGWLIIFASHELFATMNFKGALFLIIGGICYTLGVAFYAIKKVKYMHAVWHLFVLAGSIMHYLSILFGCILMQ